MKPWSREGSKEFAKVSKENKEEYKREKRVQQMGKDGFNHAAIAGMTGASESSVKRMLKSKGNIHLDGRY